MVSRIIATVLFNTKQAQAQLQQLGARGTQSFQQLGNSAERASGRARGAWTNMSNGAQGFANRINSVRFAFNSMAAAFGAGLGIQQLARASDTFIQINNRIKQATTSAAEHADVLEKLRQTSNTTGTSIEENATAFLRFNLVMDGLGKSANDTLGIIDTLNKAFVVNGSSTQEAQSTLLQLSQAFGAGALRGDEFRSVLENATFFARKLAEEMDVAVGDLKELAKEGKITTDVMLGAMGRLREETERAFGNIQRTIAMSVQELRNEFVLWAGEAGQTTGLAAAMADAFSSLAENIEAVAFAMLGLIGLLTAGALGGALAGIVLGISLLATVPGAITAGIVALSAALAYFGLRTTEAERAAMAAAAAAREHAAALRELDEVIKDVNDGVEGSVEKFEKVTKAHLEASKSALDQVRSEIEIQKALIAKNLIAEHGLEEAQRRIRKGQYDSTALDALLDKQDILIRQQEEYARRITGSTAAFENTGKAAEVTTSKIRVMHGTSIGATSLIDAHGKLVRVTRSVGEEVDKNSKKYKKQQEALQSSLDLIADHEHAVGTVTKGLDRFAILYDEMGRGIAQIDLQTGAMTELGSAWDEYQKRAEAGNKTAKEGAEETLTAAEKAQATLVDIFDRSQQAGVRSAKTIEESQVGLLGALKNLWDSLSDLSSRQLERAGNQIRGYITTVGNLFSAGVPLWGASIKSLVSFTNATIKEMQPLFDTFAEWLLNKEFTLGIGVTYRTSLGEIIKNIQERLDKAGIEIPNPFELAKEQASAVFAEWKRQAEALKTVWDGIFSGPEKGAGAGAEIEAGTGRRASVFPELTKIAEEFGNKIEVARDKFFAFRQSIEEFSKKSFYDWLFPEPLPDPLFPPIDDNFEPFKPIIDNAKAAVEAINQFWDTIQTRWSEAPKHGDALEVEAGTGRKASIWAPFIVGVEEAIASIQEKWAALPEWLKEIFNPEQSIAVFDGLIDGAQSVIENIKGLWRSFWGWLSSEGEAQEQITGGAGSDTLVGRGEPGQLLDADQLQQVSQESVSTFANLIQEVDTILRQVISGLTSFVTEQFNVQRATIGEIWTAIAEGISNVLNILYEKVVAHFSEIGPALVEALEAAQEAIASTLERLNQATGESSQQAGTAISEAFQSAISAVETAINSLVSTIQSAMNSIISSVDTAVAAMRRLEAAARAAEAASKAAARAAASAGTGGSALGGMITRGMQLGGRVWGAGSSMSDSIWRRLSRGEYVIRSAAVAKYGQRVFDRLNSMTLPKDFLSGIGMNMGGPVTAIGPRPMVGDTGGSGSPTSALFLELWQNGPVVETQAGPDAVSLLLRHSTGKRLRSLGNLPRGRG